MCPRKIGEHIVAQQGIWIPRWVKLFGHVQNLGVTVDVVLLEGFSGTGKCTVTCINDCNDCNV